MKQFLVFHPFLFAVYAVLFLFAHNIAEVAAADLLLPIVVVIAGTSIFFFSLRLITKSYNKSGIITSFFLILFFSYGHVRDICPYLEIGQFNISIGFLLGPVWVLLFIIGAFLVVRYRGNFLTFTKVLSIIAMTLVTISLVNIGIYQVKTANLVHDKDTEEVAILNLNDSDNLPDIYYIVLDMYASSSTLKEFFNYDNSEFVDYLINKRFYIASGSRSNYPNTILSLASSLNMEYLKTQYIKESKMELKSKAELYEMIQNNKVSQFLKSKGYYYIFISNGYFENGMSKYADVYKVDSRIPISNFTNYLIRTTMLAPFVNYFRVMNGARYRAKVLYSFDVLAGIPHIKKPTFVFAHVLCPHPPYGFDRNGNPPPLVKGQDTRDIKEKYLDQVIFVSKKVETLVNEILSKSEVPPIIILQSDTGARFSEAGMDKTRIEMDDAMNLRMNIFNAYFLPENGDSLLYESITPVNTFRIVLNHYFDTNYDLLEDKSYYFEE